MLASDALTEPCPCLPCVEKLLPMRWIWAVDHRTACRIWGAPPAELTGPFFGFLRRPFRCALHPADTELRQRGRGTVKCRVRLWCVRSSEGGLRDERREREGGREREPGESRPVAADQTLKTRQFSLTSSCAHNPSHLSHLDACGLRIGPTSLQRAPERLPRGPDLIRNVDCSQNNQPTKPRPLGGATSITAPRAVRQRLRSSWASFAQVCRGLYGELLFHPSFWHRICSASGSSARAEQPLAREGGGVEIPGLSARSGWPFPTQRGGS